MNLHASAQVFNDNLFDRVFLSRKKKIQLSVDDGLNNSDIADISGPLLLSAEVIFSDPLCLSEFVLAGLFQKITKERVHAISASLFFRRLSEIAEKYWLRSVPRSSCSLVAIISV